MSGRAPQRSSIASASAGGSWATAAALNEACPREGQFYDELPKVCSLEPVCSHLDHYLRQMVWGATGGPGSDIDHCGTKVSSFQAAESGLGFWLALACRDGLVRHACGSYPLMQRGRTQSQRDGAYLKAWGETRPSRAPGEALPPIVKRLRTFFGREGRSLSENRKRYFLPHHIPP